MSAATNFLENKVLDHVLGEGVRNYTSPAVLTVGLFSDNPGETGAGTEISGNAYARTGVTFGAASGGSATNSANVTFPTATGTWGTVSHAGVFDGTDMVFYGALSVSKSPTSGDTFQINAGQLTITLD
jgi:hypothetical protein